MKPLPCLLDSPELIAVVALEFFEIGFVSRLEKLVVGLLCQLLGLLAVELRGRVELENEAGDEFVTLVEVWSPTVSKTVQDSPLHYLRIRIFPQFVKA